MSPEPASSIFYWKSIGLVKNVRRTSDKKNTRHRDSKNISMQNTTMFLGYALIQLDIGNRVCFVLFLTLWHLWIKYVQQFFIRHDSADENKAVCCGHILIIVFEGHYPDYARPWTSKASCWRGFPRLVGHQSNAEFVNIVWPELLCNKLRNYRILIKLRELLIIIWYNGSYRKIQNCWSLEIN